MVFLVPWAVALRDLTASGMGLLAFFEAAAFVGILAVGLAYVWRKGDIEWIPKGIQQVREAEEARARAAAEAAGRDRTVALVAGGAASGPPSGPASAGGG